MPKRRKKANGTVAGNVPSTPTGFNPNANYGYDKKPPYLESSAGHHAIDQDKQGFLGYAFRQAGVGSANPSPFGAWMQNNYLPSIESDYDAASKINPELSFAHYAQTRGIPGAQAGMGTGGGAINTGNSYTSSSGMAGGGIAAQPDPTGKKGKKGKKPPKFQPYMQGVVQQPNMNMAMSTARHEWSKLTPEQQGTSGPAYARGPAGWSVY